MWTGFYQRGNIHQRDAVAEPLGQLDPQPLVVQSFGVLIGSPLFIAGSASWKGLFSPWVRFPPGS
jgi:hypothetical protein